MGAEPGGPDVAGLVAEHYAELYRYAYRLTGSAADAEDLTQQTYLAAQARLDQLRDPQASRGWLFAILRNAFRKNVRRRAPLPAADLELNVDSLPEALPSAEEIDQERLQAALDALTDEYRVVLLMFYFEHCSYRDIAEELELPIGTVMSRLSRAKGQLRARLLEAELHASTSSRQRSDV